jgi:hypothetical protein
MQLLFIIFGLASAAILVILLLSIVAGVALCISKRFRRVGAFVLLVPTFAAFAAGATSWGLAFLLDSMSKRVSSPQAWQVCQVLALWAWPVGLIAGGIFGAVMGVLLACLLVKRRPRTLLSEARG